MDAYHPKRRITLSFAGWKGRDYIAVAHGGDASLRRRLSDEPGAFAKGGTVYIPADGFVLTDFFDRYVGEAFIDYSAIKESPPKPKPKPAQPSRPDLPPGFMEKLRQVRYSDHTVRVYTTYFRDFQEYFEGCDIGRITPEEINGYLVFLINEKGISTCQQNQRINAIKFYYEKVLGQPRRCYAVSRAKREKRCPTC